MTETLKNYKPEQSRQMHNHDIRRKLSGLDILDLQQSSNFQNSSKEKRAKFGNKFLFGQGKANQKNYLGRAQGLMAPQKMMSTKSLVSEDSQKPIRSNSEIDAEDFNFCYEACPP